ncbi:MAG: hypothetical protein HYS18_07680 [Burkholderiales bacterium]|nr:hypothetical protein [Burkholderiales bacterium]
MQAGVVPPDHHYMMRKKALEAQFLAQYKDALESADRKQRKAILKEIDKKVAEALKDVPSGAGIPSSVIF